MLTKDLLKFHRRGDRVHPVYLDPEDPHVLRTARDLVEAAGQAGGRSYGTVEAETADMAHGAPYALGLRKLVLDRLEIASEDPEVEAFRWQALLEAETLRRGGGVSDPSEFREAVGRRLKQSEGDVADRLYADLPAARTVTGFPKTSPEWLIHRYNAALVQGLLLRARKLVVQVKGATLAEKRALFRQLKFHRLMSEVDPIPGEDRLVLSLSGPLGLFQNAQTYGVRLANFFPYLLHLSRWTLEAECKIGSRDLVFKLSQKQKLISHYKQRDGHVPEQLIACLGSFAEQLPGWKAEPRGDFVPLGRQSYSFADLTLQGPSGETAYVELFHRWHAGQLAGRMTALSQNKDVPLYLGVCRTLAKAKETKPRLESSELFEERGFLFRDMPTVQSLKNVAKNVRKNTAS